MNEPLEVIYDWHQPVVMTGLPALFIAGYALWQRTSGAWLMAFAAFVVWALYVGLVFLRRRAFLQIDDDDVAHVRRFFRTDAVRADEVVKVKEIMNGRSPDVLLVMRDGRRVAVPSSRLKGGHSVLYAWLLRHNPDVEMDKGAQRILHALEEKGAL